MGNRRKKHEQDTAIKLRFYFMSLWLLFVLIFLLTVDIPICFSKDAHFIGFGPLLKRNWLAFISLFLAILGWLVASFEKQKWAGVSNPPYEIESIKNENYEYLTFLTTYIIPLICIDLTKIRYVFVLAVLLVLIGFIFIRMDCNYVNIGLNSILKSDRIILVNGGESLEGSGRKIAIFAGKR